MFITFEGPDGSGKTTVLKMLRDYLSSLDKEYVFTREPGNPYSDESKKIREIILNEDSDIPDMTEAILYAADRRIHLEKIIWPALKDDKLVICDRYFDSSFAYQGAGRGLGVQRIIELNEIATDKTYPDITILLSVSQDITSKRVDKRASTDRLEKAGSDFHKRVYESYLELAEKFSSRYRVIDASQSLNKVLSDVIKIFEEEVFV